MKTRRPSSGAHLSPMTLVTLAMRVPQLHLQPLMLLFINLLAYQFQAEDEEGKVQSVRTLHYNAWPVEIPQGA